MVQIKDLQTENVDAIHQIAQLEEAIFSDPWSEREIERTVEQGQTICAAAEENGEVVGYYLCYYVLDECEIARIAVAQNVRKRGIGQSLFSHMMMSCREKQIQRILLDVRESNQPAISFYEKNGFQTDGIRKNYYGGTRPENAILMSRPVMEDFV